MVARADEFEDGAAAAARAAEDARLAERQALLERMEEKALRVIEHHLDKNSLTAAKIFYGVRDDADEDDEALAAGPLTVSFLDDED